jgi:methylated-DNA-[protein]-cysteine S-methyltransferase
MTQKIEQLLRQGAPDVRDDGGEAVAAARRMSERAAAEGLADISYAPVDSPFGTLHAATTKRGLVRVAFPEESVESVLERLARRLSPRIVEAPASLDAVKRELDEYFSGRRQEFDIALDWSLIGPFGCKVLRVTS